MVFENENSDMATKLWFARWDSLANNIYAYLYLSLWPYDQNAQKNNSEVFIHDNCQFLYICIWSILYISL